ncbi:MAG: hypothetical protein MJE63_33860 [Proteobacteria bacterium]|nr:hypothetical protein [Pseudomonadota bacterium]
MKRLCVYLTFSLFVALLYPTNTFALNMIKMIVNDSKYHLAPIDKIISFKVDKKYKVLTIFFDSNSSQNAWKVKIKKCTEERALEIINKIYDPTRTGIISIKVDTVN